MMTAIGRPQPTRPTTPALAQFVRTYLSAESRAQLAAQGCDFANDYTLLRSITQLPGAEIGIARYALRPSTNFPHVTLDIPGGGQVCLGYMQSLYVYAAPPDGGIGFHDQSYRVEGGWMFAGDFSIAQMKLAHRGAAWQGGVASHHYFERGAQLTFADGVQRPVDLLSPHLFALAVPEDVGNALIPAEVSRHPVPVTIATRPPAVSPWQPTTSADLLVRADHTECTGRGTRYYFFQNMCIGRTDPNGQAFRYTNRDPVPNYASHAAILARQGGSILPLRASEEIEDELVRAARLLDDRLSDTRFRGMELATMSTLNAADAQTTIQRRARVWNQVIGEHDAPPSLRGAISSLTDLRLLSCRYESVVFRFLWLGEVTDHARAFYAGRHDGLTHYQQLLILCGPEWVARDLARPPQESVIARQIRGGLLVLNFGDQRVEEVIVYPWGMAVPQYHRDAANGPLVMTPSDAAQLQRQIAQQLHP